MARRLLVVDVGATDVKWAVATDGALDAVQRTPTRRGSIRQLIDQLSGLHSDAAASEPLPWALCTAGIVDTARGRILWSGNLGLEDEPIVEQLAAAGSRPRFIVNDVDAAAVGEAAGSSLALLQIGSGVAGRMVVDGAALSERPRIRRRSRPPRLPARRAAVQLWPSRLCRGLCRDDDDPQAILRAGPHRALRAASPGRRGFRRVTPRSFSTTLSARLHLRPRWS